MFGWPNWCLRPIQLAPFHLNGIYCTFIESFIRRYGQMGILKNQNSLWCIVLYWKCTLSHYKYGVFLFHIITMCDLKKINSLLLDIHKNSKHLCIIIQVHKCHSHLHYSLKRHWFYFRVKSFNLPLKHHFSFNFNSLFKDISV